MGTGNMGRPRTNNTNLENSNTLALMHNQAFNAIMYTVVGLFILLMLFDSIGVLDNEMTEPQEIKCNPSTEQPLSTTSNPSELSKLSETLEQEDTAK
jgi:hypothetical protein